MYKLNFDVLIEIMLLSSRWKNQKKGIQKRIFLQLFESLPYNRQEDTILSSQSPYLNDAIKLTGGQWMKTEKGIANWKIKKHICHIGLTYQIKSDWKK